MSVAKADTCTGHDLIAISAKCQKGEEISTLNLLGIIHCLTGVFRRRQTNSTRHELTHLDGKRSSESIFGMRWKTEFLGFISDSLGPFLLRQGVH